MKRSNKLYEVSETNKKNIKEFIEFKKAQKGSEISVDTLDNIARNLRKLSDFAKDRDLKTLTDKELQDFFNSISEERYTSRDTYATTYIQFYRWVFKLPKRTPPPNLAWFCFTSANTKRKNKDVKAKEKYFIIPEDYKKMIEYCTDQYGRNKAIIETYYLIGPRPEEPSNLKIKDVETRNDGITVITVNGKTGVRTVGFPQTPYNLLQYLENHPNKNNKEAPLFFPFKNKDKFLDIDNIRTEIFKKMMHDLKDQRVKQTYNLKSFRKTRATIVFENQHKLGLTFKQIGDIFGWTEDQVPKRQAEYLLTDEEETLKKYCTETYIEPTQMQLKKINTETTEKLKQENIELNKKVGDMESEMRDMQKLIKKLEHDLYEDSERHIASEQYHQQLADEADEINAQHPPEPRHKII